MDTQNPTPGTEDTYEARIKALEKEKAGVIRDLQGERDKRHDLEQRFSQLEASLTTAEPEVPVDVQEEVQKLSRDPKGYIRNLVLEEVVPVRKTTEQLLLDREAEKAYSWLAKKEGKDVDDIKGSALEEELARISKERGMGPMGLYNGARAAYDIYQKELKEKERKEAEREEAIAGTSAERVTNPPRQGQAKFSRDQISQMTNSEYERNRQAILEAAEKGQLI